ncbi:MAG TPA: protein kinase [Thermoanaerobaculia bacterium]|nr:protein kinase [Thermoanaerobaculia bacterium]
MAHPKLLLEGKYEILGKIKDGGMGTIYKVRHRLLDEIRVVKVLQPHVVADAEMKRRFTEEAKTATRLKHPNLCAIYDFALDEDGTAYLVMEYIDGVNLSEMLKTTGCPGLPLSLEIAHQALLALGYLHRKEVVHRDVAPDNLMLTHDEDGRPLVKLIDLGIAKAQGTGMDLTATGVFLGKLKYASPEQFGTLPAGEKIDGRSDLYGLGIVLYELLTGVRPFTGEAAPELLKAHLFLPPVPFAESDPQGKVPPEVQAVVLKALQKKREDRYASADEFDREILMLKHRFPRPDDVDSTLAMISTIRGTGEIAIDNVTPSAQDRLNRQFAAQTTPHPSRPVLRVLSASAAAKAAGRPTTASGASDKDETIATPREERPSAGALPPPGPRQIARWAVPSVLALAFALYGWRSWASKSGARPLPPPAPAPTSAVAALEPTVPPEAAVAPTAAPTAEAAAPPTSAPDDSRRLQQAAEAVRSSAARARQGAQRAQAQELAGALYERAVRRQQEAERLLADENFPAARTAFENAVEEFRGAESWARSHPAPRASPAEVIAAAKPPVAAVSAPTSAPAPTPHVEATRVASLAPTVAEVVRPPASAPTEAVRLPTDQESIRQVLQLYERAQDTLDVDLYARVYPSLVGEKRETLERAWQGLAKQQVELEIHQIEVKGSHAVVRAFQRLSATPRIGTEQRDARERTFDLDKRGDTWVIVRLD